MMLSDYVKVSIFTVCLAMFVLVFVALGTSIGVVIEVLWEGICLLFGSPMLTELSGLPR
jgi:hypothetical protein